MAGVSELPTVASMLVDRFVESFFNTFHQYFVVFSVEDFISHLFALNYFVFFDAAINEISS